MSHVQQPQIARMERGDAKRRQNTKPLIWIYSIM